MRAVLEGVAQRGADLLAAAEVELGRAITEVRVDGGMTANRFLVQALANVAGVTVLLSPEREATTRGAGLLALVAAGAVTLDDVEATWRPAETFTPEWDEATRAMVRRQWADVVGRAERTIPDLSNVTF